ncbi:MAG: CAP domain-containing protein [Clostridia bacterium]|nr:CAP domain-containing protein [Clostridia bacterium]
MRRKILTFLLALAFCLSMAVPAAAVSECRQSAEPQTVYELIKQQLTCWLFGRSCRGGTPDILLPTAPPQQTPAQVPDSIPDRPAPNPPAETPTVSAPVPPKTEQLAQSAVTSMEQQVVDLVNSERAANGLPALMLDETLSGYARIKSQDLHDNRYFDHQSPTYGSPFDMMRSFGITYAYAGENIAMGYFSAESVVNAWMNSSGHRANILSANFDRIGVGYVADGGYWTQWFLG